MLLLPCSIIKQTINIKQIVEALENIAYIGVLKQRWEEIKKLTRGEKLALSVG